MSPRYEIRLLDRAGRMSEDPFPDCEVARDGEILVIGGRFDQAALHGLLERIRVLHLELLDVRRMRGSPHRPRRADPRRPAARREEVL